MADGATISPASGAVTLTVGGLVGDTAVKISGDIELDRLTLQSQTRLILLSAPAGYGKTTLISD